jgi:hypothetical protein
MMSLHGSMPTLEIVDIDSGTTAVVVVVLIVVVVPVVVVVLISGGGTLQQFAFVCISVSVSFMHDPPHSAVTTTIWLRF